MFIVGVKKFIIIVGSGWFEIFLVIVVIVVNNIIYIIIGVKFLKFLFIILGIFFGNLIMRFLLFINLVILIIKSVINIFINKFCVFK